MNQFDLLTKYIISHKELVLFIAIEYIYLSNNKNSISI